MQSEILHCTQIVEPNCNIVDRLDTNFHVQTDFDVNTNTNDEINFEDKANPCPQRKQA
jgi:hypothetical protein